MDIFLFYIFCGLFLNIIVDILVSFLGQTGPNAEYLRLTNFERIIVMLIWPFALLYVIVGMINPRK
jgi:hypothetical protein